MHKWLQDEIYKRHIARRRQADVTAITAASLEHARLARALRKAGQAHRDAAEIVEALADCLARQGCLPADRAVAEAMSDSARAAVLAGEALLAAKRAARRECGVDGVSIEAEDFKIAAAQGRPGA
jgi:hypothetical protein